MTQTDDDLERSVEVNELEWSFDRNPHVSRLKWHASSCYNMVYSFTNDFMSQCGGHHA